MKLRFSMRQFGFFLVLQSSLLHGSTLPDIGEFGFISSTTKILTSTTSTESVPGKYNCTGVIDPRDQLGRLALVTLIDSESVGCFTDGRYNNFNYNTEKGIVRDVGNASQFGAYRISPPSVMATEFMVSKVAVYYKFPSVEDYTIYSMDGGDLNKILEIPASSIDNDKFIKITDGSSTLTVSNLTAPRTYLFVPSRQSLSIYSDLGPGVEGARIKSTNLGDLMIYRYDVSGTPYDTRSGFEYGPADISNGYGQKRQHFNVAKSNGEQGAIWQDASTNSISITWFGLDFRSPTSMPVANSRSEILAAATYDDIGNIYYLTIQSGDGSNTETARTATVYKVDSDGFILVSENQDTSKSGLNMVSFDRYTADMAYQGGKLGLFLGRRMHESSDGRNHQGGLAAVYSADTLALLRNHGQTSAHSFDNFITSLSDHGFLGFDLGDNYPRGINLHKLSDSEIQSRVVYTFKTSHSVTETSPSDATFPVYSEISTSNTTYYQWSNDTEVYTELGAVMETGGAFSMVFAGEPDSAGKSLNNTKVGGSLNDARNVGLLQIRADFEKASGFGHQVSDDMVLSSGITETGGFYTYQGAWEDQRNTGVVWLTNYSDKESENASRVRAVTRPDGNLLVFWEEWTSSSYISTYVMQVDASGNVIERPIDLGSRLRFDRRGDLWSEGNSVYSLAGSATDNKLELFVLEPDSSCGANDVVLSKTVYVNGQTVICSGASTLHTDGTTVEVQSGANVTYVAPKITLKSGFSAESGAVFYAKTKL